MSPEADTLMKAAGEARAIADRLQTKAHGRGGSERKHWHAMSAGARMVAIRLVEMAADAEGRRAPKPDA